MPKLSTEHAKLDQLGMEYLDIEPWLTVRIPNNIPPVRCIRCFPASIELLGMPVGQDDAC
jgi:hypothetical protein